MTLVAIVMGGVAMAPAASAAVPNGCGALTNGHLCINGPTPNAGTYTASYMRFGGEGEITVRLGIEIKVERTGQIAQTSWIGYKKTQNGYASLSRYTLLDSEGCIRAIMEHGGTKFISQWRC
ncbi:hypothetical protein ACFU8I_12085 [Streptomyces sp. NPDC057540]|uniref:hypothetical protein n=1 Tax=Streptomyces sp. NPDC057540 TaxID=3346160 RepID=UPI0036AC8B5B